MFVHFVRWDVAYDKRQCVGIRNQRSSVFAQSRWYDAAFRIMAMRQFFYF